MKTEVLLLRAILPIVLTNGNTGRGNAFWASANCRKRSETIIRSLGLVRKPFPAPVTVRVTRMLGKRQRFWDTSSVGRGNWKEIEDSLVACGWFHDDSYRWIRATEFRQRKYTESCVMVDVFLFKDDDQCWY